LSPADNKESAANCTQVFIILSIIKQGIHRHQPRPQYRNVASHALPYGPLQTKVTSFIKPEVHNVSHRHQRRTEPRPQGICITNFAFQQFQRYAHRQTDRQADRNTPLPYQGAVITVTALTMGLPSGDTSTAQCWPNTAR